MLLSIASPLVPAAALFAATSARSTPKAGITVVPQPLEVAFLQQDRASGAAVYTIVTSAKWSPEAPATEGAIEIKDLTNGGVQRIGFGNTGAPRSAETNRGAFFAAAGSLYVARAKWRVDAVDAFAGADGTAVSPPKRKSASRERS